VLVACRAILPLHFSDCEQGETMLRLPNLRALLPGMNSYRLHLLNLLVLLVLASLVGCSSGGGDNSFHVNSASTGEKDIAIRSSYAFAVTKSFTDTNGKISTASSYRTYAANYDLDSSGFAMSMDKPLASEEQIRLLFDLVGNENTNDKSAPKTGTYSAKADKFMKVENVGIVTRKGNADYKTWLDRNTLTGTVKVTSISSDQISGDVDLSAGETVIKGSFIAKILKRKTSN
jgi:hypothetical protein